MKRSISMMCITLLLLVVLDIAVAGVLFVAQERGKFESLVRYFEYGRSVPGKLTQWEDDVDALGNLYDVSWRSEIVTASAREFAQEQGVGRVVVRSYGMSFVNDILKKVQESDPNLYLDMHSGPSAPPNFTYALMLDDRANRRAGDVIVLGLLSSAVPAMAALSNRTWLFEQPAPFSYPIFQIEGEDLRRIEPLVNSSAEQRSLRENWQKRAAWTQQLESEDLFYTPITFGVTWLDRSPFARLVRRSFAKSHVMQVEKDVLAGDYPYGQVLEKMVSNFASQVRSEGQIPVVVMVQTHDRDDVDLLALVKPILDQEDIPYLATVEHYDPRNPSGFIADGHYQSAVNQQFGEVFIHLVKTLKAAQQ